MGWDGWINKHIYSGETLAPRGIPRERNRVESPNTTKEEKKTDNGGKRYNATLFYTEHAIDFFTVLGFYLMRVQKKKGEAGTCQDIVIES